MFDPMTESAPSETFGAQSDEATGVRSLVVLYLTWPINMAPWTGAQGELA